MCVGAQRRTQSSISEVTSELGLKNEQLLGRRTSWRKINKWEEGSHVWRYGVHPKAEAPVGCQGLSGKQAEMWQEVPRWSPNCDESALPGQGTWALSSR